MKKLLGLGLGLCFSLSAQAHMLWLERATETQTQAFFGEYNEQLKDTQDSALKSFNRAKATQNNKQLAATVQHDHLAYATQGTGDVQLSHELLYGDALLTYHAKAGRQQLKAAAELDIVPVQANSNTFQVVYQGKPAANTEVTVFSPQYWQKTYSTDAQGQVTIATPWQGQYVVEVAKEADKTGKLEGQAYKKQYLVTSLSFVH